MSLGLVLEYLLFFIGFYSYGNKIGEGGGEEYEGEDIEVLYVFLFEV